MVMTGGWCKWHCFTHIHRVGRNISISWNHQPAITSFWVVPNSWVSRKRMGSSDWVPITNVRWLKASVAHVCWLKPQIVWLRFQMMFLNLLLNMFISLVSKPCFSHLPHMSYFLRCLNFDRDFPMYLYSFPTCSPMFSTISPVFLQFFYGLPSFSMVFLQVFPSFS